VTNVPFGFQEAARFPPGAVAMKIAIALAVGMLVGFERESANKDAIQVIGTLAQRSFGNIGFLVASGLSGIASSASAAAAAANLSANGNITPEMAGTATVIVSMVSALSNVPLVLKGLPSSLLFRIASSTALQVIVGVGVLAVQHYVVAH
jgi:uncharacterized membrane protein (DUF4010 family)